MVLEVKPDLQQSLDTRKKLDNKNIFGTVENFVVSVESLALTYQKSKTISCLKQMLLHRSTAAISLFKIKYSIWKGCIKCQCQRQDKYFGFIYPHFVIYFINNQQNTYWIRNQKLWTFWHFLLLFLAYLLSMYPNDGKHYDLWKHTYTLCGNVKC